MLQASSPPPVLWLSEVDSTNTFVREHFSELPDGTLVAAEFQTAGRGRCGRKWMAPRGANLTATVKLARVTNGFHAGCIAGLATLSLVREILPECCTYLKWPNDVYLREKKLAGLLSEGVLINRKLAGVAAGIGLNVNLTPEQLAQIDQPATSLAAEAFSEAGKFPVFPVKNLTERLADVLFSCYINYIHHPEDILVRWRRENRLIGQKIQVVDPLGKSFEGVFSGISAKGALEMELQDGVRQFSCGDVKIDVKSVDFCRMQTKNMDF